MSQKTIILKPSHRCNLNCAYCYDRFNRAKDNTILPANKLIEALQKCYDEFGDFTAIWHGGEPTVLGIDYWRQVLEAFKEKKINWSVQTNNTLINEEWAKLFQEYGCSVGTSWDGITNTERTHNSDSFFNFLNIMKKYNINHSVLYTVTPENYKDILNAAIFGIQTNTTIEYNFVFDYYRKITDQEYNLITLSLLQVFDLYCSLEQCTIARPFNYYMTWLDGRPAELCERKYCQGDWISIDPHGNIRPCGKPWSEDMSYGNIFDPNFSFDNIKTNKKINNFFEEVFDTQWEHCKDCRWLLYCNNGCPYSNLNKQTGKIEWNRDWCMFNKALFDGMDEIIKTRYLSGTLINSNLSDSIESSPKTEVALWRNSKSHTI